MDSSIPKGSFTRTRVGLFNECIKSAQTDNSLSYCVLRSKLHRSERALRVKLSQDGNSRMVDHPFWELLPKSFWDFFLQPKPYCKRNIIVALSSTESCLNSLSMLTFFRWSDIIGKAHSNTNFLKCSKARGKIFNRQLLSIKIFTTMISQRAIPASVALSSTDSSGGGNGGTKLTMNECFISP